MNLFDNRMKSMVCKNTNSSWTIFDYIFRNTWSKSHIFAAKAVSAGQVEAFYFKPSKADSNVFFLFFL